jgi:hypothetical protein
LVRRSELPAPNQFYFYLEPVDALSVGEDCGMLGVLPDYYRYMSKQAQDDVFKDLNVKFPYANIRNLNILGTCVPEFGVSYRGINVTTPCSAVAFFHTQNQGTVAERMERSLTENRTANAPPKNLPRGFTAARQNVALKDDYMYMYQALDAQWEVSIALRASLLGVTSFPYTGSIDRTQFTGCALQSNNPNNAGTIAGYVCSGVPEGSPAVASYTLYAECDPSSGLLVRSPSQLPAVSLGAGECKLLLFTLVEQFASPLGAPRYCSLYLGSTGVFSPNNSLTLDSTTLLCDKSSLSNYNTDNLLITPADALTLSNASIVSRKNYTAPEVPDKSTAWYLWGFLSIALGVFALVVLGGALFIWARAKMSEPAKMKVVE